MPASSSWRPSNRGLLAPYIGPLKARIRKLLEEGGHSADVVTSRVVLQPFARRRVDEDIFGQVSEGVLSGTPLSVVYDGRERGALTRRRVHPYRLLHYRDNWYLVGWCERARWVADEIWHPDQIGQWVGDAYELQVPYSDPRELLMDILKYGPDVEVIAPEEFRRLVAERVRETAAHYDRSPDAANATTVGSE